MRLFRFVFWFVASLVILSLPTTACAQQDQDFETGLNPYRTYQAGNIDTINLLNHGLNVDIPLISYPQRGGKLTLAFDLHYINQGNWWTENPGGGYTSSGGYLQNGFGVILKNWPGSWGATCQSVGDQYGTYTCQGSVTMSDGSVHSMLPITLQNWESEDTSGFQMDGYDWQGMSTPPVLIGANGTLYNQPFGPESFSGPVGGVATVNYVPTLAEDTNGNQITYSQSTGWTDTMGRQIPLPVSASTSLCPTNPLTPVAAYTWNLPGVNGGTYKLTFCYVDVPVTINWEGQILHKSEEELQTVILPNSTSWGFQYTSDGNGDLSQITFPTGGTLSYTWRTEYLICAADTYDNARAVLTRTLNPNDGVSPAGTWNYGYISNVVTVVTDPSSYDTVHTFGSLTPNTCPYYETETQYYQGSHSGGTLLKTVNTKYQSFSSYTTTIGQPSLTETLWPNNQENETTYAYDSGITFHDPYWVSGTQWATIGYGGTATSSYGLLETQTDHDYGSGAPGNVLRTTSTSYEALSNSNYLNNNLLNLPSSVTVTGAGPGSTTKYAYDQTTPVASNVSTQHSTTPPAGTYRGNLTTESRYLNTNGTYLSTTYTVYDTGMVYVIKDPKSNPTSYCYSPTYAGAYLTCVTNALGQTTTYTYDFNTGLLASTTDPNSQTTSYAYDDMLRATGISYPDGGHTSMWYEPQYDGWTTGIQDEVDTVGDIRQSYVWVDGLGRSGRSAMGNGEALPWNEIGDTCYNKVGLVSFKAYPYQDGGWNNPRNCNALGDSFTYDALGRNTKITHSDGSVVTTSYTGSCATTTDEQSKTRESCTDGLGRMTEVIENPGGLNYATNYTYDALDNLTSVSEVSSRQRTFVYDSLSRLTSATNPESGTTSYTYDGDGNVATRTDARSITTTYVYDALNRLTSKTYSDGTAYAVYNYDQTTAWGGTQLSNPIGRLTTEGQSSEDEMYSYDAMGRVTRKWQCNANCGIDYATTYTYDLLGNMITYTNPVGVTFSQSFVNQGTTYSAGRVVELTSSWNDSQHPATIVSGIHYNASGNLTAATLANGLTESAAYNGLVQPCRMNVNSSGALVSSCTAAIPSGSVLDLTTGFNYGAGDNGNLMSWSATGPPSFNKTFTYDALNRLATMSSPGNACTGLSWNYDAWGNRTDQTVTGGTCDTFHQAVGTNNRFTSSPYQYDAAGNMTHDASHSYTYDAEDRLTQVDGGATATYVYDAEGRRVQKTAGGVITNYVYDLSGRVMSEYGNCQTCWNVGYMYLNGQAVAEYYANTTYFYSDDHLGSTRLITGYPTPTVVQCEYYYPFGENVTCGSTETTTHMFAGYERDSESGLDNAQARYYGSPMGRFMSPDPGNAGADPTNPQSWNMYSYVLNSPLIFTDPTGLDPCGDPTCTPGTGNGYGYTYFPPPDLFADPQDPQNQKSQVPDPCVTKNGCITVQENYHPPDGCSTSDATCAHFLGQILHPLDLRWNQRFNPHTQAQPWYKNSCVTGALAKGALNVGIDSIGLIPEAGGIARVIGHQAGYVGVVADRTGRNLIRAGNATANTSRGLAGLTDTSPTGLASTGLTIAGFVPVLSGAAAVGSIGLDLFRTAKAIRACY